MEVAACKNCRRLFNYMGGDELCPECKEQIGDIYHLVKEYVYDHRGCTVDEVAQVCGVDRRDIQKWVREGKLEYVEAVASGIKCMSCGIPITSGSLCMACREKTAKELNSRMQPKDSTTTSKNSQKQTARMHTSRFSRF